MKIAYVLLVAVVVLEMVEGKPSLNENNRAERINIAKRELVKSDKIEKRSVGALITSVTGLVGNLTSTVTGLLSSLNPATLDLSLILGGVFDVVRTITRWPNALLELLRLKVTCMSAGRLLSQILGLPLISTILDVVCPVVFGILEAITENVANLVDEVLDNLEDLFPLLQCINLNILLTEAKAILGLFGSNAGVLPVPGQLGLCVEVFGSVNEQANLLGGLVRNILKIPQSLLGGLLGGLLG